MDIFQSLVLGIVEGVTEFLPVSSTGHMVLVSNLMGISDNEFVKTFEIFIQLGAIFAVGFEYGRNLIGNLKLLTKIMATFIPTGILGLLFYSSVKQYLLGSAVITVAALIFGGVAILLFEKYVKNLNKRETDNFGIENMSYIKCVVVGFMQSLAMIPGVSRSAMTIMGGMLVGLSRVEATMLSFLVATPTLFFASFWDLYKTGFRFSNNELMLLGVGFVSAFITALIVVRWFIKYLRTHTFEVFGWYRIVLGIIYALVFLRV